MVVVVRVVLYAADPAISGTSSSSTPCLSRNTTSAGVAMG